MESVQEVRLARLVDERRSTTILHDNVLSSAENREDGNGGLSESQAEQVAGYRERMQELDAEIGTLTETVEATRRADSEARRIRALLASESSIVDVDGEEVGYRTFAAYARDEIIAGSSGLAKRIAGQLGSQAVDAARERLLLAKRTPANTLSSDVPGLTPAQHIAQIFQVIDSSRPLVASALRDSLERGQLTYPRVDSSPVVAVQSAEKTEAGNTGMDVSMQTATASVYLGGGDLSWQAVNWSTPNALDLWFRLAAADYALKTEQDAAQVLQHSAFSNNIDSGLLGASPTFAEFMTAVGLAYGEVFDNSGRIPDTIYMSPDRFGVLLGLTSSAFPQFVNVGQSGVGPLSIVVSRGMDAGVIVVGDRQGLLVAETPGAPVELSVVEPAIGGYEVGIIGAFEAVVVDDGAFAMITTAS